VPAAYPGLTVIVGNQGRRRRPTVTVGSRDGDELTLSLAVDPEV
jgi:hypothetical protein